MTSSAPMLAVGDGRVEHEHETEGPRPIRRMLQGAVTDPFGHLWLIGRVLA